MLVAVLTNNATVFDNTGTGITVVGTWSTVTNPAANPTGYGANYRTHAAGTGTNTFTWTPNVTTGSYRVYARWVAGADRATNATYQVTSAGGVANVVVNQRERDGEWVLLGTYNITANQGHKVRLTDAADGVVVADAVKFVPANYSNVYMIDTDHLDTPRVIRSSTGVVVWRWDSDPFGSTPPNQDPDGNGVAFSFPLRFPGQFYDAETGTHYNYFRDYDPQIGRYVQSDPIGLAGGINTYTYVNGNPLSFTDPTGLVVPLLALPLIGGSVGLADVGIGIGLGLGLIGLDRLFSESAQNQQSGEKTTPADQVRDPTRSKRGEARCRCKAATNAEGGRGPTPQEWFYAERSGPTVADAARAACRQANKHIGIAYPGCQGEHCHCVCSEDGGPPFSYNPR